jgi:hypothetical protein
MKVPAVLNSAIVTYLTQFDWSCSTQYLEVETLSGRVFEGDRNGFDSNSQKHRGRFLR